MNGSGSGFDFDLSYGEDGERYVRQVLGWLIDRNPRIEVKRKRRLDDLLYIELMQNPRNTGAWEPSGLNTTTADLWSYVIDKTGVILTFPTDFLRWIIRQDDGKSCETFDSDNPTKGRLLRVSRLIQMLPYWLDQRIRDEDDR